MKRDEWCKYKNPPVGARFGLYTVLGMGARYQTWLVRCACGRERSVQASALTLGRTRSCTCQNGKHTRRHGHTRSGGWCSPEYSAWRSMLGRCSNKNNRSFHRYGGRGIRVCDRWSESFENFYADMGPKPSPKHSLDRIDNDGNYEPGNCRWATRKQQQRNMRSTRRLLFGGQLIPLTAVAELLGADPDLFRARIRLGWSIQQAAGKEPRS